MSTSNIDFDALLVDWLYGELDSTDTERFEKHLESHPEDAAEAAAMRRVRAFAKTVDQAEPPPNLTTILMHEAAVRAKSNEKGAGLWAAIAGFFQPVFMHPAATAMASLVLVVGVAGALYMRNGSDMIAEPRANSSAEAPASAASKTLALNQENKAPSLPGAGAPESESAGSESAGAESSGAESSEPVLADEGTLAEAQEAEEVESDLDSAKSNDVGQKDYSVDLMDNERELSLAKARVRSAPNTNSKNDMPNSKNDKKRRAPSKPKGKITTTDSRFGNASTNAVSGSNRGYAGGKELGAAQGESASEPTKKSEHRKVGRIVVEEQSWEADKASTFRTAAKGKKCKEAGRIANDIRDRKPDYYKSSIAGTKEESDCRFSIVNENKRRAKQRVARKAKSTKRANRKQGKSVPKKALAAPQESVGEANADADKGL